MSWHAILQYLKYRWYAKTRHGVHSPFVYDFIGSVLYKKDTHPLAQRIENYFGKDNIVTIKETAELWPSTLQALNIAPTTVVLFNGIHSTKKSSRNWELVANSDMVKLSIDMYGIGLLFFRDEFKQKQHFILKT